MLGYPGGEIHRCTQRGQQTPEGADWASSGDRLKRASGVSQDLSPCTAQLMTLFLEVVRLILSHHGSIIFMNKSYFCGKTFLKVHLMKSQEPLFSRGHHVFGEERSTKVYFFRNKGFTFYLLACACVQSCPTLCDRMSLLCPWDFPGKKSGVG